jgi:transcriptional regulator with XRE-family HTH domain
MSADGSLGAKLREMRRARSLTQEQLAAASGISQVMIAKIEQGRRLPRLPVLMHLANALDISLSELIDNQPRLNGHSEGASVLAIRDMLLSPALLRGVTLDTDDSDPAPLYSSHAHPRRGRS